MADFVLVPEFDAQIEGSPPPTLQTRLSDGKVISRVKHSNAERVWREQFKLTGAEFDAFVTFFDSKGVATAFTKLSYDVYGTPTQERTVRFAGPWQLVRAGLDFFIVDVAFVRHF